SSVAPPAAATRVGSAPRELAPVPPAPVAATEVAELPAVAVPESPPSLFDVADEAPVLPETALPVATAPASPDEPAVLVPRTAPAEPDITISAMPPVPPPPSEVPVSPVVP
ncbi:MAG TPA: DUF2147 domain-containing protein, partial [Actinomycetes bacterium]|nr:DUF2147 domain-containing protein [Actinomycetes bacterium]